MLVVNDYRSKLAEFFKIYTATATAIHTRRNAT